MGNLKGRQVATATGEEKVAWRRSQILFPPRDAAQGDQLKTVVSGNNYSSSRVLDDENVDDNNNRSGGGRSASMIEDKDDQAGAMTGGNGKGNCLHSRLI